MVRFLITYKSSDPYVILNYIGTLFRTREEAQEFFDTYPEDTKSKFMIYRVTIE